MTIRLLALPSLDLTAADIRHAQVAAAALVRKAIPDDQPAEQRARLAELLDALGLNPDS